MVDPGQKINHTLRRWVSLIACSALATSLWFLIESWVIKHTQPFVHLIVQQAEYSSILLLAAITAIAYVSRVHWVGFLGLKHFFHYPPIWLASLFAILITTWPILLIAIIALSLIPILAREYSRIDQKITLPNKATSLTSINDFSSLQTWLKADKEINHPDQDYFGYADIAQRIAERILKNKNDPPSIALIGSLGSGKSSTGRMVEHYLKQDPNIRHLQISLWPYSTSEAAVNGILSSLIDRLSQEINTFSLRGLQGDYLYAIERVSGPFSGLVRLLKADQQPETLLERIGEICQATGLSIVLWIEDLERFANIDANESNKLEHGHREEKLAPLRSLLYLLDKQQCISVIVADTSLNSRFDLQKIARYIESLTVLTIKDSLRIINLLRQHCLEIDTDNHTFIDPVTDYDREYALSLNGAGDKLFMYTEYRFEITSLQRALWILGKTPRNLKSGLRLTHDIWEKLKGEIDFDHLLFINLIKTAHPDLFSFVYEYIDRFRNSKLYGTVEHIESTREDYFNQQLESLLTNNLVESNTLEVTRAYRTVLAFLFPDYTDNTSSVIYHPQGLNYHGYWERYIAESICDKTPDQTILIDFYNWKSGHEMAADNYSDYLLDNKYSLKAIHYLKNSSYDTKLLPPLLESIVDKEYPTCKGIDRTPSGIRLLANAGLEWPEALMVETFDRILRKYMPLNLPYMLYFQKYFDTVDIRFNDMFLKVFQVAYPPANWQELLNSLDQNGPQLIAGLIKSFIRTGRYKLLNKEWPKLVNTLMEAGKNDPYRAVPLIVATFVDKDDQGNYMGDIANCGISLYGLQRLHNMLNQNDFIYDDEVQRDVDKAKSLIHDEWMKLGRHAFRKYPFHPPADIIQRLPQNTKFVYCGPVSRRGENHRNNQLTTSTIIWK